jgi:hypothetical protein
LDDKCKLPIPTDPTVIDRLEIGDSHDPNGLSLMTPFAWSAVVLVIDDIWRDDNDEVVVIAFIVEIAGMIVNDFVNVVGISSN